MANAKKDVQERDGGWSEPLPPPIIVDGFWHVQEGATLEGVVLAKGESKFGEYIAVRVKGPVEISQGGEYIQADAGSTVGIAEFAAIRALYALMEKGPIAIRIRVKGKVGKAWDMEVRHRPAF